MGEAHISSKRDIYAPREGLMGGGWSQGGANGRGLVPGWG